MKPLPHRYDVRLSGDATGYATTSTGLGPALRVAPPVEYDGPGDAWTPEHLLLAAVQSCFLFTLSAVARASRIDLIHVDVVASGTVDRREGVTRFTEIVLCPTVTLASGSDRERINHILEKAERACLVSASLSTPVRLQPVIVEKEAVA
jgi:peroxiredoxin-like protein